MLDNEPDTDNLSTPEQPSADSPAPPPRRRRAASRPAGPPSSAPDAPPIEPVGDVAEPQPDPAATDAPATEAPPAKRPARKRAATKPVGDAEEKPARAPRKRTAKKAVAAEQSVDELLAPAEVDQPEDALPEPETAAENEAQPVA